MRRGLPGWLLLLLCAAACSRCARGDVPARVREAFARELPGLKLHEKDADTYLLLGPNGWEVELHLDNLRAQCRQSEELCASGISNMVAGVKQILAQSEARPAQKAPDLDLAALRAVLKDAAFLAQYERELQRFPDKVEENRPLTDAFAANLSVMYVFDTPSSMVPVRTGDLAELKLDRKALRDRALANLEAAAGDFALTPVKELPGVFTLECPEDNYEAARLILHQRWERLRLQVKGDLIAVAPARSHVYVAGSKDPEGLEAMRGLAADIQQKVDHPLSLAPLRWTPQGWVAER